MPLVEAIVGSTSNDLYEAIFEVDAERDLDLFDEEEEELPHLRSVHSQENLPSDAESRKRRPSSVRRPASMASGRKGTVASWFAQDTQGKESRPPLG